MADEGAPYDSFRKAYNGAVEHYERGHRDDYIAKCRVTLSRPNIPRGIWLRTIILLGTVFPHRETRHEIHAVAESYWRALRRSSPIGRDVEVDTILQETRKSLDELQVTIAQEREVALVAESSDGGNDLEEGIVASQTVDKEKAEDTDTEELTLEEMIAVKPRQFDMVIEELRKLDTSELNVMWFVSLFDWGEKEHEEVAGGVEGKGCEMDEKAIIQARCSLSFTSTASDSTELTPPSTPECSQDDADTARLAIPDTHFAGLTDAAKRHDQTRLEGSENLLKCRMRLAEEEDKSLIRRTRMAEEELESLKRRRAIIEEDHAALLERLHTVGEEIAELKM